MKDVFPCQYWVKKNNSNSRWYDLKQMDRTTYFDVTGYDSDKIMFNLCNLPQIDSEFGCKNGDNAFGYIV